MRSLGWILFLIGLQTFVAGIFLTQVVTDYKVGVGRDVLHEDQWELEEFYGSLDRSMFVLYQTLSEGIHWGELSRPLAEHISPFLEVAFIFYSAFSLFVVMNIITGVFVGSALTVAEEEKKLMTIREIGQMWIALDRDGSGDIQLDEFVNEINAPEMEMFLKEIDMVPTNAIELFKLLDADGSGYVTADELVNGCARLKGDAKALDLAVLQNQMSRFVALSKEQFAEIECLIILLMQMIDASVSCTKSDIAAIMSPYRARLRSWAQQQDSSSSQSVPVL